MGVALAHRYQHTDRVAVGFLGDGGINVGRVWESANLAAIWKLRLIIVCENNQYAVETPIESMLGGGSIVARGKAFGLESWSVDGQDVAECARIAADAVARARAGDGPSLIEARTYRYSGHDVGDREAYRTRAEVERWQHELDPVRRLRDALISGGRATAEGLGRVDAEVAAEVEAAVEYGEQSPDPDPDTRYDNVYSSDAYGMASKLGTAMPGRQQ